MSEPTFSPFCVDFLRIVHFQDEDPYIQFEFQTARQCQFVLQLSNKAVTTLAEALPVLLQSPDFQLRVELNEKHKGR
jgi:hypothetical protein